MRKALVLQALLILSVSSMAQNSKPLPLLGKPQAILAEGKPLIFNGTPAPLAYDFDHDGKKDLLIGEFNSSNNNNNRCLIYLNAGTGTSPKFSKNTALQADGEAAVMPGA